MAEEYRGGVVAHSLGIFVGVPAAKVVIVRSFCLRQLAYLLSVGYGFEDGISIFYLSFVTIEDEGVGVCRPLGVEGNVLRFEVNLCCGVLRSLAVFFGKPAAKGVAVPHGGEQVFFAHYFAVGSGIRAGGGGGFILAIQVEHVPVCRPVGVELGGGGVAVNGVCRVANARAIVLRVPAFKALAGLGGGGQRPNLLLIRYLMLGIIMLHGAAARVEEEVVGVGRPLGVERCSVVHAVGYIGGVGHAVPVFVGVPPGKGVSGADRRGQRSHLCVVRYGLGGDVHRALVALKVELVGVGRPAGVEQDVARHVVHGSVGVLRSGALRGGVPAPERVARAHRRGQRVRALRGAHHAVVGYVVGGGVYRSPLPSVEGNRVGVGRPVGVERGVARRVVRHVCGVPRSAAVALGKPAFKIVARAGSRAHGAYRRAVGNLLHHFAHRSSGGVVAQLVGVGRPPGVNLHVFGAPAGDDRHRHVVAQRCVGVPAYKGVAFPAGGEQRHRLLYVEGIGVGRVVRGSAVAVQRVGDLVAHGIPLGVQRLVPYFGAGDDGCYRCARKILFVVPPLKCVARAGGVGQHDVVPVHRVARGVGVYHPVRQRHVGDAEGVDGPLGPERFIPRAPLRDKGVHVAGKFVVVVPAPKRVAAQRVGL